MPNSRMARGMSIICHTRWLGSKFRVETYRTERPADDRRFCTVIDAEAVEITAEIEPPDPGRR